MSCPRRHPESWVITLQSFHLLKQPIFLSTIVPIVQKWQHPVLCYFSSESHMTVHTLHCDLSWEEVKTLVCMTFDVARCLAEKDIHRLKSVWQPPPLQPALILSLSVSCQLLLRLAPFHPVPCSQLTYGPAVFHPALQRRLKYGRTRKSQTRKCQRQQETLKSCIMYN